jgi:hypothetical protein
LYLWTRWMRRSTIEIDRFCNWISILQIIPVLVVTSQQKTMEAAGTIYGVTMRMKASEGCIGCFKQQNVSQL